MSDTYTTVTRRSWLDNIFGSMIGALFGIALFLFAFPVIWFSEGRTNLATVAKSSIQVEANQVSFNNDGKLVGVTGSLIGEPVGDAPYLAEGDYLALERSVEMFAWVETEKTETEDNLGGGSTETTTYSYSKRWTTSPENSDNFYRPSGHYNPPLSVESASRTAEGGQIGEFSVDLSAAELPWGDKLVLDRSMVLPNSGMRLAGEFLFQGKGTPENPQVGDIRISYTAVPNDLNVTIFGQQSASELVQYQGKDNLSFLRALEGNREAAINQLQTEHTITSWILRFVTLFMLWIGLSLLLGPINAVLGVIPALKQLSGCLVSLLTFIPAFLIWAVAVTISIIAHNIWLLIGAVLIVIAISVFVARRWQPSPRMA